MPAKPQADREQTKRIAFMDCFIDWVVMERLRNLQKRGASLLYDDYNRFYQGWHRLFVADGLHHAPKVAHALFPDGRGGVPVSTAVPQLVFSVLLTDARITGDPRVHICFRSVNGNIHLWKSFVLSASGRGEIGTFVKKA